MPSASVGELVGWWKLDEKEGTAAADSSGKGNNGTTQGGKWVEGRIDGALDVSAGCVAVPDSPSLKIPGDMTFSLWIKKTAETNNWTCMLSKGGDVRNYGIWLCFDPYGRHLHSMGSTPASFKSATQIDVGRWYHVAVVAAGNQAHIYIDGKLESSAARPGPSTVSTEPLWIGGLANGWFFTGVVDDVRVYSRALSADEIHSLASVAGATAADGSGASLPAGAANLVANGGFEEADERSGFAKGWKPYQGGKKGSDYTASANRSNPRTGEQSLVVRSLGDGAQPGAVTSMNLSPGRYVVRYRACTEVGQTARVCAHLAGKDLTAHPVGGEWEEFTETVEFDKKRLGASLKLWTTTPRVRVWFDDVEVYAE